MRSKYSVQRPPNLEGIVELVHGGIAHAAPGRPSHWHSEWQLVAVTRGDGWVRVRGTTHRTPAGSLFLIPPEAAHSNGVFEQGCDWRSMLIEPAVVQGVGEAAGLRLDPGRISRHPVLCSTRLTQRFDRFHRRLRPGTTGLRLEEELATWIIGLLERRLGQNEAAPTRIAHPAARRARECLWARADENISLHELAQTAGLSRFELSRQFKAAYGMPPHAWQLQVRIERAKSLLKSGVPAGEVAVRLGFADQAHFSRVFRRATGYTPATLAGAFRNNVQDHAANRCKNGA